MSRLDRVAIATLGIPLLVAVGPAAHAAAPARFHEHVTDVFACGDPDHPDFVVGYEADFSGIAHDPLQRGNTDAAAHQVEARTLEVYTVGGHQLSVSTIDNGRESSVRLQGDTLFITVDTSGIAQTSLDGSVIARAAGTLRISYSENTNGTPNDRSDDFDYQFVAEVRPGFGHQVDDSVDPCAALAPFAP